MSDEHVPSIGSYVGLSSLLEGYCDNGVANLHAHRPGAVARHAPPASNGSNGSNGTAHVVEQSDTSHQTAAIIEQARSQARFEARRIRAEAVAAADEQKAALLEQAEEAARAEAERRKAEMIAEAERLSEALLDESRAQALFEAAQLRDEGAAEARQLRAEAERAGVAVVERAEAEADRLRQQALAEAERVKAAIISHAREVAEEEGVRVREEALLEAEQAKASMIHSARQEADSIRAEAVDRQRALLDDATGSAVCALAEVAAETGPPPEDWDGKLLTASAIGTREFPEVRRGFDPTSVTTWLKIVQTSYSTLEAELHRSRHEWERALEALEVAAQHLRPGPSRHQFGPASVVEEHLEQARAAWLRSMEVVSSANFGPDFDLPSLLARGAALETRLGKRLFGFSVSQVQRLLGELTIELARLENQLGVVRAENDQLRSRLLGRLATSAAVQG